MLNFGDDRFFVKYAPWGDISVTSLHRYFIRRPVGTQRYILHFTPPDCVLYGRGEAMKDLVPKNRFQTVLDQRHDCFFKWFFFTHPFVSRELSRVAKEI